MRTESALLGLSRSPAGTGASLSESRPHECLLAEVTDAVEVTTPSGGGEFVYIDDRSVDVVSKRVTEPRRMLVADAPAKAGQLLRAGDVLVGRIRPQRNPVALVSAPLEGAFASTDYSVLRPRPGLIDARYLFWWVQSPEFVTGLVRRAGGGTAPTSTSVTDASVRSMPVPLPTVRDQQQIAAILDDATQLRFERCAALDLLGELQGALLLDLIDDAGPGVLSDLVETVECGPPSRTDPRMPGASTVAVIPGSALTVGGEIELAGLPGRPMAPEDVDRFALRAGDLLLSRGRNSEAPVRVALFRGIRTGMSPHPVAASFVAAPNVVRLRLRPDRADDGSAEYLLAFLTGAHGGSACRSLPNRGLAALRSLPVPLPSIDARKDFGARAEQVRQARANERLQLTRLSELFAVLQYNGFSGRF